MNQNQKLQVRVLLAAANEYLKDHPDARSWHMGNGPRQSSARPVYGLEAAVDIVSYAIYKSYRPYAGSGYWAEDWFLATAVAAAAAIGAVETNFLGVSSRPPLAQKI
jgi:hypothetical protein